MNDTVKTIVGLLETGKPELQVAAAQILGELRAKEPAVARCLGAGLRRSNVLGRFCLEALAKIATPDALQIIAQATVENESLADHAAHLLTEVGAPAHGVLATIYPQAIGDQRQRILGILARSISKDSVSVLQHALLAPETAELAARLLGDSAGRFPPALQKPFREGLTKHLESPLPELTVVKILETLARVDAEGSRSTLLAFTDAQKTPSVRSAAFRGLRRSKLTATQVRACLEVLEDQKQKDVQDAVRDLLVELPELPEGLLPVLKRLLVARAAEQRLFALRMLRTAGGAEMAKVAVKLLDHDDDRFRAAAAEALANNKQAAEPLLKVLLTSKNLQLVDMAGSILLRLAPALPPKFARAAAEKAVKLVGGNTKVADLLIEIALAAAGAKLVGFFVERAVRLRRAHQEAQALHLLARLAASPHGDHEVHYQIALTKLLLDMARPEGEAGAEAPGNSTMGFFAVLARNGFPLFDRLRKENAVTPEAMLRIATHFTAAVGPERRLGTDLLQHLAMRTKGRAGDEARVVLRAVGG